MWSVWSARLLRVTGRHFHQPRIVTGLHSMAEGTNDDGNGNRDKSSSDEAALSARLGSLDHRLSEIRDSRKIGTDQSGNEQDRAQAKASAMAVGLRLSSELVAGVLVGAALGWGFDRLLSTSPWGLIVFLLLGFTAGVLNVMRAAGVMAKQSERL
jgi:ATP synthase protein I